MLPPADLASIYLKLFSLRKVKIVFVCSGLNFSGTVSSINQRQLYVEQDVGLAKCIEHFLFFKK